MLERLLVLFLQQDNSLCEKTAHSLNCHTKLRTHSEAVLPIHTKEQLEYRNPDSQFLLILEITDLSKSLILLVLLLLDFHI